MYHSFFNSSPIKGRLGHFQFVAIMIKIAATAAAAKSLQSCPTVQPHRRQPTRLPCPWDSQDKNKLKLL